MTLSDDAKAILLLCGRLSSKSESEPLRQRQYNQLARWLQEQALRPADLLDAELAPKAAQGARIPERQLIDLLRRGVALGFAVEAWDRNGIWVVCRSDPDYPSRLKTHLREKAPPILFGAGEQALLGGGGMAIVGSRNVDATGEQFARDAAAWCARSGLPVVSGGARGVDQIAMKSALDAGGCVIGVLADNLLRKSVARDARSAISDDRLLLMSPYHPEARFTVGTAMGRNKLIYAMADSGLVVSAEYRKGGTWTGAEEELKRSDARPIFVRIDGDVPSGNEKLLDRGARPFPASWREAAPHDVLQDNAREKLASRVSENLPLFVDQPAGSQDGEAKTDDEGGSKD